MIAERDDFDVIRRLRRQVENRRFRRIGSDKDGIRLRRLGRSVRYLVSYRPVDGGPLQINLARRACNARNRRLIERA